MDATVKGLIAGHTADKTLIRSPIDSDCGFTIYKNGCCYFFMFYR